MDRLSSRISAFLFDAHLKGADFSSYKDEIRSFLNDLTKIEDQSDFAKAAILEMSQEKSELQERIDKLYAANLVLNERQAKIPEPVKKCSKCGNENGEFCSKCVQVPALIETLREQEQGEALIKEIVEERPKPAFVPPPHSGTCILCKQQKGWRALQKAKNGTWSCLKVEECVRSTSGDEEDEKNGRPIKVTSSSIDYFYKRLSSQYGLKPFEVADAMVISGHEIEMTESMLGKLAKMTLAEKLPNTDKKPEHFRKWRLLRVCAA